MRWAGPLEPKPNSHSNSWNFLSWLQPAVSYLRIAGRRWCDSGRDQDGLQEFSQGVSSWLSGRPRAQHMHSVEWGMLKHHMPCHLGKMCRLNIRKNSLLEAGSTLPTLLLASFVLLSCVQMWACNDDWTMWLDAGIRYSVRWGYKVCLQSAIATGLDRCTRWLHRRAVQQVAGGPQTWQKWRSLWRKSPVCGEYHWHTPPKACYSEFCQLSDAQTFKLMLC